MNRWNLNTEDNQPKKSGEYEAIAMTCTGSNKCLFEIVDYSTDDGWQTGNNWDVIVWRKKNER